MSAIMYYRKEKWFDSIKTYENICVQLFICDEKAISSNTQTISNDHKACFSFFLVYVKMSGNKVFDVVCTTNENGDKMHNERT